MKIPLRLGPLAADGYEIHRSGVRWLCEPGQVCRANQVVAFFNISVKPARPGLVGPFPFVEERELQVACAPRVGGRLMYDSASAPGGYLSILGFNLWDADSVLAHLEIDGSSTDSGSDMGRLRLLMLAGRRMTPLADVHSGLLAGWHARSRAWWCEGGTPTTLLSLGVCDVTGVVLGEEGAFLEMFRSEKAPSQFVSVPDHPIAPSAAVLLDQLERTAAQFGAISADFHSGFFQAAAMPTAEDWMFAGTMLSTMQRCPIRDTYEVISESGLTRTAPADAVFLTLNSEPLYILRHKALGYRLNILRHYQIAAGPAIRGWLDKAFEPVRRTTSDMKDDYENLVGAINKATGAHVIILNRMSTSGDENISTYAPFDAPMSGTLAKIASKELNLMLHDVAAAGNVSIIDVDAIAADMGGGEHLPDGVHQSSALQEVLRQELLLVMKGLRTAKLTSPVLS
jgi:hypothetical protein